MIDTALMLSVATGAGAYVYLRPTDLFHRALGARMRLAGIRPHRTRLPRAQIRYWTGGRGAPVVFVHGFGTEARVNWYAQLLATSRRFRVLAPDLPGFGGSERVCDERTIAFQVACLRDLLDHLGCARVHLVGHSMGGWITLAYAAAYPEHVERLVVVDAAGLRFSPDLALQRLLLPETTADAVDLIAANFRRPPRLPQFVLRDVLRTCRRDAPTRTEVLRQLVYGEEFVDDRLASIVAPTLIVWGRHDVLTPLALGERLRAGIVNAELVVFDHCAHSPNIEEPAAFNALLLEFLSGARDHAVPPHAASA